ncbi:PLP-dependent cysteine synthase family protein [Nesterenkonia ebinurensis]|uniref:PLP-dependent cysteine synthase family protein n=1 Tax=Nesterenkonia ebinurensis TaxID=2608252 RepID=UPI0037CC5CA1
MSEHQLQHQREWVHWAIRQLRAEATRTADTHVEKLLHQRIPEGVDLYVKDESAHSTGSLKHRLARSLVLLGLCNGDITEGTPLIEASSGSTAVSEAYFAHMLQLSFYAVMPATTVESKQRLIERYEGQCVLVEDGSTIYQIAEELAQQTGGYYMNQFRDAERATDWRGNNNIAESLFNQLSLEAHPTPEWVVVGAGTGGTSTTIGRYIRYRQLDTRLCVADVEHSAFFHAWDETPAEGVAASRIEGIGRPRVEPSFTPNLIDRMVRIPDAASIAAMRWGADRLGRLVGGSTGTNLWAALMLADEMAAAGQRGSIVTLLCDQGERYRDTYYNDDWLENQSLDLAPYENFLSLDYSA